MQFASIELVENVQRTARTKIQLDPGSRLGNPRRDRRDQNDRRIIIHGNTEGRSRLRWFELIGLQRLLQAIEREPDRRGKRFGPGRRHHSVRAADKQLVLRA
jgi:hypothetical protein